MVSRQGRGWNGSACRYGVERNVQERIGQASRMGQSRVGPDRAGKSMRAGMVGPGLVRQQEVNRTGVSSRPGQGGGGQG